MNLTSHQVLVMVNDRLLDLHSFCLDVRRPDLNGDEVSRPVLVDVCHGFIASHGSNVDNQSIFIFIVVVGVVNAIWDPVEAPLPVPVMRNNTFPYSY